MVEREGVAMGMPIRPRDGWPPGDTQASIYVSAMPVLGLFRYATGPNALVTLVALLVRFTAVHCLLLSVTPTPSTPRCCLILKGYCSCPVHRDLPFMPPFVCVSRDLFYFTFTCFEIPWY